MDTNNKFFTENSGDHYGSQNNDWDYAWIILLVLFLSQIITPFVMSLVFAFDVYKGILIGIWTAHLFTAAVIIFIHYFGSGLSITRLGLGQPQMGWLRSLTLIFFLYALNLIAEYLYLNFLGFPLQQHIRSLVAEIATGDRYILFLTLLAAVTISAPIIEEMVFRGHLLEVMEKKTGPIIAILISSLLFSGLHFDFYSFPLQLLLGLSLGIVYILNRSILPAVILHSLINITGFIQYIEKP